MADPGEFLARWSRLKREAEAERSSPIGTPETSATTDVVPAEDGAAAQPQVPEPAAELPPIETLDKDSDYTPFMRESVPDELRNQALRKLWSSDPVFANIDGLVDYDEDFGAGFKLGGVVATAYRILKGMPGPEDQDGLENTSEGAEAVSGRAAEREADSDAPPLPGEAIAATDQDPQ